VFGARRDGGAGRALGDNIDGLHEPLADAELRGRVVVVEIGAVLSSKPKVLAPKLRMCARPSALAMLAADWSRVKISPNGLTSTGA
jgi:hypothetical protein